MKTGEDRIPPTDRKQGSEKNQILNWDWLNLFNIKAECWETIWLIGWSPNAKHEII